MNPLYLALMFLQAGAQTVTIDPKELQTCEIGNAHLKEWETARDKVRKEIKDHSDHAFLTRAKLFLTHLVTDPIDKKLASKRKQLDSFIPIIKDDFLKCLMRISLEKGYIPITDPNGNLRQEAGYFDPLGAQGVYTAKAKEIDEAHAEFATELDTFEQMLASGKGQ